MLKKKIKDKLKNKPVKGLFAIMITAILLFSVVPAITFATNTDTTDNSNEKILVKAKAATIKVTWNANGGKIGTKTTKITKIKKGSKINKLPATPKRVGYSFKGWYTKKTGGTKITTKTKPKKKVTYFAQWNKKTNSTTSRVLTDKEKNLVGYWSANEGSGSAYDSISGGYMYPIGTGLAYSFHANGTFYHVTIINSGVSRFMQIIEGSWRESGGTIYLTNTISKNSRDGGNTFTAWATHWQESKSMKIQLGTDATGQYFVSEPDYSVKFYKETMTKK